jgi:hypothetical protein
MSDFAAESYYWSHFDRFELLIPGWMILEAWHTRQVPDHFADLVRRPDRCTKQAIAEELAAYAEDVDPEEEADNWKYIVRGRPIQGTSSIRSLCASRHCLANAWAHRCASALEAGSR